MNKNLRLIFWETTKKCNLKCAHCRASAEQKSSPSELTTRESKRFISQVAAFAKPILVFSGGEPFIREDIFELLQYADEFGLRTGIATNATMITGPVAAKLKKSRIGIVAISIYGPDAESHDTFCSNEGTFKRAMEGISNLKEKGIPFQINTTITKQNIKHLEAMADFAVKHGAGAYHVFFLVPTGRGRYIKGDEISPYEYESAFNRLYDLQSVFSLHIKATCAPHYYRVSKQRCAQEGCEMLPGYNSSTKGCLAGQEVCFLSDKGEVFGCGYLPISVGNIKERNFEEIWSDSFLFSMMRDESKLEGKCGVCEYKHVCGGCRARAYASTGNYLGEEPECVYQPSRLRSGLIVSDQSM